MVFFDYVAEALLRNLVTSNRYEEARGGGGSVELDEHVDIAVGMRLPACERAEQRQAVHAKAMRHLGLVPDQEGQGVVSVHASNDAATGPPRPAGPGG